MAAKHTTTRSEAARMLAEDHFATDEGLKHFFVLRTPHEAQPDSSLNHEAEQFSNGNPFLKVLEVTDEHFGDGIRPLYFNGNTDVHGVYWPSLMLIRITMQEFKALKRGKLKLPDGLKIDDAVELFAASLASGD